MPPHRGKFVAYFRVSTDRQGKSRLGLEAQRKSVLDYLDGGQWQLVTEFTEVESGKRSDRPELEKALAACKKHKAKLVIAKLDRLSRNLAFIATQRLIAQKCAADAANYVHPKLAAISHSNDPDHPLIISDAQRAEAVLALLAKGGINLH